MAFSSKFVLDAKMQNIAFWIIPIKSFFRDLVALNVNFQGEKVFQNTKIYRKCKFKGVWIELQTKLLFSIDNPGHNTVDKFTKLSKICFSMECFRADFWQFSNTTVVICL